MFVIVVGNVGAVEDDVYCTSSQCFGCKLYQKVQAQMKPSGGAQLKYFYPPTMVFLFIAGVESQICTSAGLFLCACQKFKTSVC